MFFARFNNRGPKGQTARKGGAQNQRPKGGNSYGGRAAEGLGTST